MNDFDEMMKHVKYSKIKLNEINRYYLHGTTWHPVMGPFGPMDCVNCQCRSGRIECQRLECPSRPALNCERPVKVAGRCCPVCPLIESDIQGRHTSSLYRHTDYLTISNDVDVVQRTNRLQRRCRRRSIVKSNKSSHPSFELWILIMCFVVWHQVL